MASYNYQRIIYQELMPELRDQQSQDPKADLQCAEVLQEPSFGRLAFKSRSASEKGGQLRVRTVT